MTSSEKYFCIPRIQNIFIRHACIPQQIKHFSTLFALRFRSKYHFVAQVKNVYQKSFYKNSISVEGLYCFKMILFHSRDSFAFPKKYFRIQRIQNIFLGYVCVPFELIISPLYFLCDFGLISSIT